VFLQNFAEFSAVGDKGADMGYFGRVQVAIANYCVHT